MKPAGAFKAALESVRALRSSAARARAVLDMTGDQLVLIIPDGKPKVVFLGESIEDSARSVGERLPRGAVVNCVLPARMVTVRRWPVPNASMGAVRKIVAARIAAEMPLVAGDFVWSFELADTAAGRTAVVHLVKRRYVESVALALEKAGLTPGIFENEASLLAALATSSGETSEALILRRSADVGYLVEADRAGPRAIVAVGAFGSSTAWVAELARRWREKRAEPPGVRLYIAPGDVSEVREAAESAFALEPHELVVVGPAEIRDSFPAAAAVLATPRAARRVNLNPFAARLSVVGRAKEFLGAQFGLLAAVCAFVIIVCAVFDFAMARITSRDVASALNEAAAAARKLDSLRRKTEMLDIMARKKYDMTGLLFSIVEAGRAGVKFEEIAVRGRVVGIKGLASSGVVEKYIEKLKAIPIISAAEVLSIRGNRFEIRCGLSGAATTPVGASDVPARRPAEGKGA